VRGPQDCLRLVLGSAQWMVLSDAFISGVASNPLATKAPTPPPRPSSTAHPPSPPPRDNHRKQTHLSVRHRKQALDFIPRLQERIEVARPRSSLGLGELLHQPGVDLAGGACLHRAKVGGALGGDAPTVLCVVVCWRPVFVGLNSGESEKNLVSAGK